MDLAANKGTFRLQRYFSLASLATIVVAAVLLGLFYRYLGFTLLLNDGENKNVAITRVLANGLWPQMSVLLKTNPSAAAREQIEELNRVILGQISGLRVVKVKIYDPRGLTVFSTDLRQIGEDQSTNRAIYKALGGEVVNSFVQRDHFNELDQVVERRDLMQTYMPIGAPDSDVVAGVFEVYSDYTPILSRVRQMQWLVMLGTGIILMILYGVLFFVVRHADRVMEAQQAQLRTSLGELTAIRFGLEQNVSERTRTLQVSNRLLEQEIEERLRMERIIREREQRLRAIMDNLLNAVVVLDEHGNIESMNPSAELMFGFDSNEFIGQNMEQLLGEDIAQQLRTDEEEKPFAARIAWMVGDVIETSARHKEQNEFPVELVVTESEHAGQRLFVASFRDVSARRLAEQQLEEARQKFAHQEKMAAIGTLAAGIVHEIGNPIAAITGLIQDVCQRDSEQQILAPEVRANLDLVLEHIQRLISINRDVSEFGNPQGGTPQLVDFNNLVGRTCRLMRHDQRLQNIELRLQLDPLLPALTVVGDQMIQVIMNLISNAADAIQSCNPEQGLISIETVVLDGQVCLTIADNGCGMDESTAERATEAFYTTKPMGKGTGLGLSLCHSIISAHHGDFTIRSEPGGGTKIHVLLPCDEAAGLSAHS